MILAHLKLGCRWLRHASADPISAAFQTGLDFEAKRRRPNFEKPRIAKAKEYSAGKND
jgi:hypothetical protein